LNWVFDDCDVDNTLTLTWDDIKMMNSRLEPCTDTDEKKKEEAVKGWEQDATEFMEVVDKDGSGLVTLLEWFNAWERLIQNEGLEPLDSFLNEYASAINDGRGCDV
jgi:hypothetical protein